MLILPQHSYGSGSTRDYSDGNAFFVDANRETMEYLTLNDLDRRIDPITSYQNIIPNGTALPHIYEILPIHDPYLDDSRSDQGLSRTLRPSQLQSTLAAPPFQTVDRYDPRSRPSLAVPGIPQREEHTAKFNTTSNSSNAMLNPGTTSTDPALCECRSCGMSFKGEYRKGNLKRHMKSRHQDEHQNEWNCPQCSKIYRRRDALLKHTRKSHPGVSYRRQLPGTYG
jgi:uncharacterized C2H2 Zn-finger protein